MTAVDGPYGGVYLVGGTVRDILLGEPSFDVDIAVEGDAIAFARSLAEALGGRVRAHDKFGTAVVLYGEDERVDVVTARTESYESPGALPTVAPGSIEDDLFRRDFTINAMAASLEDDDRGRLVDPFDRHVRISRPDEFGCSTTDRFSTTRLASSGRSATRIGTASGWTSTPQRSRTTPSRRAMSTTSPARACAKS